MRGAGQNLGGRRALPLPPAARRRRLAGGHLPERAAPAPSPQQHLGVQYCEHRRTTVLGIEEHRWDRLWVPDETVNFFTEGGTRQTCKWLFDGLVWDS